MLKMNAETKIGRFWEYPNNMLDSETLSEIEIISKFKEKTLIKVKNGEWTEEEYKHFTGVIKKITIKDFLEYIEIAELLVDIPRDESKKIINYLKETGFFKPNISNKSEIHDLAELIRFLQSKLFSIANISVTSQESEVNNTLEEKINIYEQISAELENTDSEYSKIYKELLHSWINETFASEEVNKLKTIILNFEDKIFRNKKLNINNYLRKLHYEKKTRSVDTLHMRQGIIKTMDRRAMLKK